MEPAPSGHAAPRHVALAIAQGFRGLCPACGEGRILSGYVAPANACARCGELLAPYRTADFAPYLVTFAIGVVFTPLAVFLSASPFSSAWLTPLMAASALGCAALLLPRAKGAAVALLWALDVEADQ